MHPALSEGRTAVITGAASGIGLAAAKAFARLGMKVCLADLPGEKLDRAAEEVAQRGRQCRARSSDPYGREQAGGRSAAQGRGLRGIR